MPSSLSTKKPLTTPLRPLASGRKSSALAPLAAPRPSWSSTKIEKPTPLELKNSSASRSFSGTRQLTWR